MHRTNPDTIAFLAPGLAHQFGNLLLTIQGHALHLDTPDIVARAQAAILTASERGGDTLRLLRHLLGEPGAEHDDVAVVWARLCELLRVPVREAGFVLDVQPPPLGGPHTVAIGDFAPLVVEAVRALVAAIPDGASGAVVGTVAPAAREVVVHVRFQRSPDSLPFPLDTGAAAHRVATGASRCGWRGRCRATADGLEVGIGLAGAVAEA